MTLLVRIAVVAALAAGGAILYYLHGLVAAQRTELEAARGRQARWQKALREAEERQVATAGEREASEGELAAVRLQIAQNESAPTRLWAVRVALLRQLLDELPSHRLAEMKLLGPLDWIEVARKTELDTTNKIRAAFEALRLQAVRRMADRLKVALQRFVEASGGQLPRQIGDLAPYLAPPVDGEMLGHYSLARTGRLGDKAETLITGRPMADFNVNISHDSYGMSHSDPKAQPGETEQDAMNRVASAVASAFSSEGGELMGDLLANVTQISRDMGATLAATLGEGFGADFNAAVAQFKSAHAGEAPKTFAQIYPFLQERQKYYDAVRPVYAKLQYMVEHQFRVPASAADLQPYLQRNIDPQVLFRDFGITVDGEHGSMNWSFSNNKK